MTVWTYKQWKRQVGVTNIFLQLMHASSTSFGKWQCGVLLLCILMLILVLIWTTSQEEAQDSIVASSMWVNMLASKGKPAANPVFVALSVAVQPVQCLFSRGDGALGCCLRLPKCEQHNRSSLLALCQPYAPPNCPSSFEPQTLQVAHGSQCSVYTSMLCCAVTAMFVRRALLYVWMLPETAKV